MDKLIKLLTIAERVVVIAAAVFAFFPLYQWWEERDDRSRDRLANITQMLSTCTRYYEDIESFKSMGAVDVWEHICSEALSEINQWEDEVYSVPTP